jgi:hypothetical protein
VYFLCLLFGMLAASHAAAQSLVGAWTITDTTAEGASMLVFFPNGCFIQIQNAMVSEAPHGFDGFERGTYTWDPATGAFAVTVLQDLNGDTGLSNLVGLSGVTIFVSGDTATATIPGSGAVTVNRVTGASPLVGAWGNCSTAPDKSSVLVFLGNGVYFQAQDGPPGDPTAHDGIEHGTYAWNPATGVLTSSRAPAPYVDTNGMYGLSDIPGPVKVGVSADGLTATLTTPTGSGTGPRVGAPNAASYQGLWWKADEGGWGVNFAHQGEQIYATWYTYDTSGNAYWLSMLASRTTAPGNEYHGDISAYVGPAFNNFTGTYKATTVGDGTITFSDANTGTFAYNLNAGTGGATTAISQSKPITRYVLDAGSAQPTCSYQAAPDLKAATNYQDLWWLESESGWGVNFAHQGDRIYATWYTYDAKGAGNNAPLWLSALLTRDTTTNVFRGGLDRYAGARFDNFKASDVGIPPATVGKVTVAFTDGNHATFQYVTDGTGGLPASNQTKSITRLRFAPGATVCQ